MSSNDNNNNNSNSNNERNCNSSVVESELPCVELIKYNRNSQDPVRCGLPRNYPDELSWNRYVVYPLLDLDIMPKTVASIETGLMVKSYPSRDYCLLITVNEWAARRGIVVINTYQDDVEGIFPPDISPLVYNTSRFNVKLKTTDYYFELRLVPKYKFRLKVHPYVAKEETVQNNAAVSGSTGGSAELAAIAEPPSSTAVASSSGLSLSSSN